MTDAWSGLMSPAEYSNCIGAIYDCTLDPDLWPRALEHIGKLVHGVTGVILMLEAQPGGELTNPSMRLQRAWNVDQASAVEFETKYAADNPLARLFPAFDLDEPYNVPMVMDPAEWERTRLFREFAVPRGYRDSIGVYLMKSPRRAASLSISTSIDNDYCGQRELAIMRLIAPHARRALAISNLIDMQAVVADGARSSLDALAPGVVLLDAEGRVLFANRAILDRNGSFAISLGIHDRFEIGDKRTDAAIRQMLDSSETGTVGQTFAVPNDSDDMVFVHAVRIEENDLRARIAPRARLALFCSPSRSSDAIAREAWADGFGLTGAEIRVLGKLVAGMTPEAIAGSMGIGLATVRTHLSRLYAKTGTERQSELTRMANLLELPVR